MNIVERIADLLDEGSFVEIDEHVVHDCAFFGADKKNSPGDGIVVGFGTVSGRKVCLYGHDASFLGGSSGKMHALKIGKVLDLALKTGVPVIALNDSSGIRIHEGVDAGALFGHVFFKIVKASGVVPQISLILGDCVGGAAYAPALNDFIIMTEEHSNMFLTGPTVIKAATGESVTKEQIGGASVHSEQTGLTHFLVKTEHEALQLTRKLLSFLPQNNCTPPLPVKSNDTGPRTVSELKDIIPQNQNKAFDVLKVIMPMVDDQDFLEIHKNYAPNIVVGFARIGGRTVAIIANQPNYLAGCLDIAASEKAARFVRMSNAFSIPIISLIDVAGYLPGLSQETGGIIKSGAKLLHAYCEASVPKIAVVLRKAYGGAYPTMANLGATDLCFALPSSEIAVMGPEGAVDVIFRKDIAVAEDSIARRKALEQEYQSKFASARYAARKGYIDNIIDAEDMRNTLISSLSILETKISTEPLRRHSNIPL